MENIDMVSSFLMRNWAPLVIIPLLLYLLNKVDRMSGKVDRVDGRMSIIQNMFKEFMGWVKPSSGMPSRGRGEEASAGEIKESENARVGWAAAERVGDGSAPFDR